MLACQSAVYIYAADVVGSTEVNKYFTRCIGNINCALVPYAFYEVLVLNSRKLAFRAKRYVYCAAKRHTLFIKRSCFAGSVIVNFKLPQPVKIHPISALKLRTRIFLSRYIHIYTKTDLHSKRNPFCLYIYYIKFTCILNIFFYYKIDLSYCFVYNIIYNGNLRERIVFVLWRLF